MAKTAKELQITRHTESSIDKRHVLHELAIHLQVQASAAACYEAGCKMLLSKLQPEIGLLGRSKGAPSILTRTHSMSTGWGMFSTRLQLCPLGGAPVV